MTLEMIFFQNELESSKMEFIPLMKTMTNLENENKLKETNLSVNFTIDYDLFPKIRARYGTSWLSDALELYTDRSKGNSTHKIYNDCLFETKPSWLMLERSELSDNPWEKVEKPNAETTSLVLWDVSQWNYSLGTKNGNKALPEQK